MSRRKRLHRKLYARVREGGKVEYAWPDREVLSTGRWLDNGNGKGKVVTKPRKAGR